MTVKDNGLESCFEVLRRIGKAETTFITPLQGTEAIDRLEQALVMGDKLYPKSDPRLIDLLMRLAKLRLKYKGSKSVPAYKMAEMALQRQEKELGSLHMDLIPTLHRLAECCQYPQIVKEGDKRAAEALRRVAEIVDYNFGSESAELAEVMYKNAEHWPFEADTQYLIASLRKSAEIFEKLGLKGKLLFVCRKS